MSPSSKPTATDALQPLRLRESDLASTLPTLARRRDAGRALREAIPLATLGTWAAAADRPDPLALVLASDAGRDPALLPLRMQRMASSPFAFLRGSAVAMAADLASSPVSGLQVLIDGDAHFANFGLFGTPDGRVVVDLNDFDEVLFGPWEWDLKRLTASVEVAGREIGLSTGERAHAVRGAAAGYRGAMQSLAELPVLALWQRQTAVSELLADVPSEWAPDEGVVKLLQKAEGKARASDNRALRAAMAQEQPGGGWRFQEQPPVLSALPPAERAAVAQALQDYLHSLSPERRFMLQRYRVADVAHRVVGVGSVGLRAWVVMLFGNDAADPLFLQVKQAAPPAHAPYAPPQPAELAHDGRRVVHGQRLLQAFGDPLLGWTTVQGLPCHVRQMRNLKGSFTLEKMNAPTFAAFAWAYGALLARAHARTGDAVAIAAYCGNGSELDEALQAWAVAYAERTEADHALLCGGIARGEVPAAAATAADE